MDVSTKRLLFIRHAAAIVSETLPPAQWPLSDDGVASASDLAGRLVAASAPTSGHVVASDEVKAAQTARIVTDQQPRIDGRLGEVARPWYPDADVHRRDVLRYLAGEQLPGWEPHGTARDRFDRAVAALPDGSCVVTHGTILSLWLGRHVDAVDAADVWLGLRFPDAVLVTTGGAPTMTWLGRSDGE